jgi:hypothetical protein
LPGWFKLKPDSIKKNAYQEKVLTVVDRYKFINTHLRFGDKRIVKDEFTYGDVSGLDLEDLNNQLTVPNDWKVVPEPAGNKLVLYRYTNTLYKRADLANLQTDIPRQGEVFTCEGFSHTTLHSDRFYEIYSNKSEMADTGSQGEMRKQHLFILEIEVDLSNQEIPIPVFAGNVSLWPYQHEVILPHASMFRVINVIDASEPPNPRVSVMQSEEFVSETIRVIKVINLRLEYLGVSPTFTTINPLSLNPETGKFESNLKPLFRRHYIKAPMPGMDDLNEIRPLWFPHEYYYGGDAKPHATRNRLGMSFCVALLSIAASLWVS